MSPAGAAAAPIAGHGGEDDGFMVGVAISVFQNSGDNGSNWTRYQSQRLCCCIPTIAGGHKAEDGPDFWNNYQDDIKLAASLGSNCFRFSLEWARLEPRRGEYDAAAWEHYDGIVQCIKDHGMHPHATLHHYVHPTWFEDLGAFEKEQNIAIYVEFARECFRRWGNQIRYWTTFNEITVYIVAGYLSTQFPPGKLFRFRKAGQVYANMLTAHTRAYRAIKELPGGGKSRIGIVHNWFGFVPKGKGPGYAAARGLASWMNTVWGNEAVLEYFKTGVWRWSAKLPFTRVHRDEGERPGLDFFGLNFYSRGVVSWACAPTHMDDEPMTDMPYGVWEGGLLKTLRHISSRLPGTPIQITESGVADKADKLRGPWIESHFAQVAQALDEGIDVRSFLYWTLMDNFEWHEGFFMKFGLHRFDPGQKTRDFPLKDGAKPILEWFARLKGRRPQLAPEARSAREVEPEVGAAEGARLRQRTTTDRDAPAVALAGQ
ncbi:unnamed protein product [Pedinophyceae sp. YPF-701]|nr:unnamed protein product [Pedinophyceae sp. YPF-701]